MRANAVDRQMVALRLAKLRRRDAGSEKERDDRAIAQCAGVVIGRRLDPLLQPRIRVDVKEQWNRLRPLAIARRRPWR